MISSNAFRENVVSEGVVNEPPVIAKVVIIHHARSNANATTIGSNHETIGTNADVLTNADISTEGYITHFTKGRMLYHLLKYPVFTAPP